MKRDYSYFTKNVSETESTSSVLRSSSKWLNHAGLRDWLVTQYLRRNGPDMPMPADTSSGLAQALDDLRDVKEMTRLIDAEKEKKPEFRDWLEERPYMDLTLEDFAKFPPDSFGGIYYRYLVDNGYELNLSWGYEKPETDLDYIRIRSGQIHDFEHLMTGGQFNSLGELLPLFCRLSNPFRHYSPELAQAMSELYIFVGPRMVMRSFLHYPQTWPMVLELIQRGIAVGEASAPVYEMRFEDALHLPIPEARDKLGFVGAEDFDSEAMDLIFTEQVEPA